MSRSDAHIYYANLVLRGAVHFEAQKIEGPFISERISSFKIEMIKRDEQPAIAIKLIMKAPKNSSKALVVLDTIARSVLGYISLMYDEPLWLESISLVDPKDNKLIQQQESHPYKTQRKAEKLDRADVFNKAEELALYWIGKGITAIRPDDKLSSYYAAAEALIPHSMEKEVVLTVCPTCKRPFASEPMKEFLTKQCNQAESEASLTVRYRGHIVHGRKSSISHYETYSRLSDGLLKGLQYWFAQEHGINIHHPQFSMAPRFRIEGKIVNLEDAL